MQDPLRYLSCVGDSSLEAYVAYYCTPLSCKSSTQQVHHSCFDPSHCRFYYKSFMNSASVRGFLTAFEKPSWYVTHTLPSSPLLELGLLT